MNTQKRKESQRGSVEVEAMFILPIAIISVVMLIYLALFIFQRANLQSALETTLIYYKNQITDTYVEKGSSVGVEKIDGAFIGSGNTYQADQPLNPYRGAFGDGKNIADLENFRSYFQSVSGKMLFHDGIDLTIAYENGFFCDEIVATAEQTFRFPLKFELLAMDGEYSIHSTARVAVVDHDAFIRNTDYAIQLVADTRLGAFAKNAASKVTEIYQKIKTMLDAK